MKNLFLLTALVLGLMSCEPTHEPVGLAQTELSSKSLEIISWRVEYLDGSSNVFDLATKADSMSLDAVRGDTIEVIQWEYFEVEGYRRDISKFWELEFSHGHLIKMEGNGSTYEVLEYSSTAEYIAITFKGEHYLHQQLNTIDVLIKK